MKIISWNINGIRATHRQGSFVWLQSQMPDLICLQETKADQKDIPDEIKNLKSYTLYLSPAVKKGYAGTAIYAKKKPNKVNKNIGIEKFDNEGRFLLLEYPKFVILNTYFPHTQRNLTRLDYKLEFNQAYLDYLTKMPPKPVILTGDYNYAHNPIDLANPKQNKNNPGFTPQERGFGDQMQALGWIDVFRYLHPKTIKYTWWTYRSSCRQRNIGWRIDYFFIQQKYLNLIKRAEIYDQVTGSDHCPISLDLNL